MYLNYMCFVAFPEEEIQTNFNSQYMSFFVHYSILFADVTVCYAE